MSSNILKYFLFVVLALFSYEKVKATAGVCSSAFYGLQKEELFTWIGTGFVEQKAVQS